MAGIPVVLLTGFLGSGKTTLLNDLLKRPAFRDTAVVINEAGDVGIDHTLMETGQEDVLLLEGGCICCRMRGSLNSTLGSLLRRRALEGLGFRRVIVETSGLAEPAPILHALIADPNFNRHFSLSGVTAVVDAANFTRTIAHHFEGVTQVALADRILVTKTDIAAAAELEAVEREIASLNPGAERFRLSRETRDGGLIWFDPLDEPRFARNGRFAATGVSHGVATASLTFPGRLTRAAVDAWLDRLGDLFGSALLRLKGIVWLDELDEPVVLHGVQGLVYSPGTLPAPSQPGADNRMVLIARGIEEQDLADALTWLARTADLST